MKTGRTLQELAVELDRQAAAKRDFVIAGQSIMAGNMPDWLNLNRYDDDGKYLSSEQFIPNELFHRQIGNALGIPAKYYDKMRAEAPFLLGANLGGWLSQSDKRYMVRTLDGTARALLSDRYRRIDNYEIAQATLPIIGGMPDAKVESCEVTENRMYIKVVNPRLEAEVQKGDIVQAGIVISNSEVGHGSVSVMPLVYRLACLNGMIINDLGKRKYHIGRENEEAWELFSDETLQADDAAFMLKLADIVRTAVDEAKFAAVVDKLRDAASVKITAHVPDVVELTARQYGFTKNEETDILQHLITGGDLSLYGLSNAVTRVSQDAENYDRATSLESAGWQIVTMPPDVWRGINAAGVRLAEVAR
jgi:hypothetical protein